MNETNEIHETQENPISQDQELAWKARAARRAQMREKKKQQKLFTTIGLIVLLAAVVLLAGFLIRGCGADPAATADPTTESTSEPATETPTQAPTLPPVTWMTFPEDRALTAQQYFVYDADAAAFLTISGEPDEVIYPASVTKLFTAYVAMQYIQPDAVITATDALDLVVYGSSVAGIEYGEKYRADTLVEAMLLPSGNDAACVLAAEAGRIMAENPDLSAQSAVDQFVSEMNRQARELGMTGSNFANPDGIHQDDHRTTFEDLAVLGKLALENETILKYAGVARDTVQPEAGSEKQWKSTNATIDPESAYYCPYAIGLKTGSTPRAGSCLLSAFECGGRTLIIGVFGCPEDDDRFADTLQLFNEAMDFNAQ